jgi:uncharacterized protein
MKPYWSPYKAGLGIGLTLLAAFVLLGSGLGASGFFSRVTAVAIHSAAPEYAENQAYWKTFFHSDDAPLKDWMVFMVAGVFAGGLIGALTGRRVRWMVEKGSGFATRNRLALAFVGGTFTGIAARIARGCTSGQALTGGAELAVGSWAFMLSVFAGGYMAAWFVRRQWQ